MVPAGLGHQRVGVLMLRLFLIVSGAVLLVAGILAAQIQPDPESWFFTAQEIEIAYRYQEGFGERLRNPFIPYY